MKKWRCFFLGCLVASLPLPLRAQVFLGDDFQVNTFTPGNQYLPHIAADSSGRFVVVWADAPASIGGPGSIFAARLSPDASPIGTEFQVNSVTAYPNAGFDVASEQDGDFVVAWTNNSNVDVVARRFMSDGSPLGTEFVVNTSTALLDLSPAVASDADGDFIVAWWRVAGIDPSEVIGQRFASNGGALGGEFLVNSYTVDAQSAPAVASDADGDAVVVWSSVGQDGDLSGIFGRRFASDGTSVGTEFQVNGFTIGNQYVPQVASGPSGDFMVVWGGVGQSGSGFFGRLFSTSGAAVGDDFLVGAASVAPGLGPDVARDGSDDFVVVWNDLYMVQVGNVMVSAANVFGRRFSSTGAAAGGQFRVNNFTPYLQGTAAVAAGTGAAFAVVWSSEFQDGSSFGVFGRNLSFLCPTAPIPTGCRAPGKSLLLIDVARDKLIWKWVKGAQTQIGDLGDPTLDTAYGLCVYDASGLQLTAEVGAGANWSATGTTGFKYKDSSLAQSGIKLIKLKAGVSGSAKAIVKGKGAELPDPTLPLTLPVKAQLINGAGECWESEYTTSIDSSADRFKAKF